MGAYVDPPNETKEQFLKREGIPISALEARRHNDFENYFVVGLIDHFGHHTAAGIAFHARELQELTNPADMRPIEYFIVPKEKLLPVSNLEAYLR